MIPRHLAYLGLSIQLYVRSCALKQIDIVAFRPIINLFDGDDCCVAGSSIDACHNQNTMPLHKYFGGTAKTRVNDTQGNWLYSFRIWAAGVLWMRRYS